MNACVADDDRADRAAKTLRQAERRRGAARDEVAGRHVERDGGVEQPGAIDEQRHADLARDVRDGLDVGRRERLAHRKGVRVLDREHRGDRLVDVVGVADGVADRREIHRPVVGPRDRPDRRAGDDRVPGALAAERVDLGRTDDLAAARDVGHEPDEIAHRAARDQQRGLGAEEFGGSLLELADGRVLAEDVVADLGRGHRAAHGRGGECDGVRPEVDHAVPAGPRRGCRVAHRVLA